MLVILASKKVKNKFQDLELVTADNKNAVETLFCHFKPPKGYDRHPHRFMGKIKFFRLIWTQKSAEIAIFALLLVRLRLKNISNILYFISVVLPC